MWLNGVHCPLYKSRYKKIIFEAGELSDYSVSGCVRGQALKILERAALLSAREKPDHAASWKRPIPAYRQFVEVDPFIIHRFQFTLPVVTNLAGLST